MKPSRQTAVKLRSLRRIFCSVLNLGAFDLARFSEFLTDKIDATKAGYELKFLGKNYTRMLASLDTETVIVPDESHNALPENIGSENVYISGDNLDGLKHLLQSYAGKVKRIYIDMMTRNPYEDLGMRISYNKLWKALNDKSMKRVT